VRSAHLSALRGKWAMIEQRTSDPVAYTTICQVQLDFEQRQRACILENHITDNEYATAALIVWLRDHAAELEKKLEVAPKLFAALKRAVAGVHTDAHDDGCRCEVCESKAAIAEWEGR
jgi:hypothetical protein